MSNENKTGQNETLVRGLTNRHIQLIALGGAIGTGLFLGIGPAAVLAGPSVILGYALAGIIAFLLCVSWVKWWFRNLFREVLATSYLQILGNFPDLLPLELLDSLYSGNYELTAIGHYIHFWWPEIPLWVSSLFFFIVINAL